MKRSYIYLLTILLVACNTQQTTIEPLPADIVMKNAAQASVLMESAAFSIDTNFTTMGSLGAKVTGEASFTGILQQSGEQIESNTRISATINEEIGATSFITNADLIVNGKNDVYLKIHDFTSDGARVLLPPILVTSVRNVWLSLSSEDSSASSVVTQDPRLLYAQAQVISVQEELLPAMIDNRIHYHYKVEVDNDKFVNYLHELSLQNGAEISVEELHNEYDSLQVDGEIWIDAQTFHVRQLLWSIHPFVSSAGTSLEANIFAHFSQFNTAPQISIPQNASKPEQLFFLDAISGGVSGDMQFNIQENMIESLPANPEE